MNVKPSLALAFLLLPLGLSFAWVDLDGPGGAGICTCSTNCTDCHNALNNNVNCTNEVRLTTALSSPGTTCINDPANFNNKVFDCQGYAITGNDAGSTYGIYLNGQSGNTIQNCTISDYSYGVYLSSSSYNTLIGNTAYSNSRGFSLSQYNDNNNFVNNTVYSNSYGFYLYQYNDGNNFTSNTVYSGSQYGFFIYRFNTYNTFTNNTAHTFSQDGFYSQNSDYNTFISNTVYNNNYGFRLAYADYSTFISNTAHSNDYGIAIDRGTGAVIESMTLYDNTNYDLLLYGYSSHAFNVTNALFLNPGGTLVNYTNLSIYDVLGSTEGYKISWTPQPATTPGAFHSPFSNKSVDIATYSGSPYIDKITWHWTDAEAAAGGYNESRLELWRYSGSWVLMNDTPNNVSNTLMLYSYNPASTYAIFHDSTPPPVGCMNFSHPGSYTLAQNAFGAPFAVNTMGGPMSACILINSSNVALDCAGYNVTSIGSPLSTVGIFAGSGYSNIVLSNCTASGYQEGFLLESIMNAAIFNSTAYSNSQNGISAWFSPNFSLRNSRAYGNVLTGFTLLFSPNNELSGNRAYNNSDGFSVAFGSNITLANNRAYNNSDEGIVVAFGSNFTVINNSAYSNLNRGFYIVLAGNSTFINNTAHHDTNEGFYIIWSRNTSFRGNVAHNNTRGFYLWFVRNNTFTQNRACQNTEAGFKLFLANTTLINNTICRNGMAGVYFENMVQNSTFIGNRLYGNAQAAFYLDQVSINNTFTRNRVYNNPFVGFYLPPGATILDTTFTGNIISGNLAGTYVQQGFRLNFTRDVYYNNGFPFLVMPSGVVSYTATELMFLNPRGTFENYSTISAADIAHPGDICLLNWSNSSAPLPAGYLSFSNKFSDVWGLGTGIDYAAWSWEDEELSTPAGIYDESRLQLWKYNFTHGWAPANLSSDVDANTLSLHRVGSSSTFALLHNGSLLPLPTEKEKKKKEEPECSRDSDCPACYYCSIANDKCMLRKASQCAEGLPCNEGYTCTDCTCVALECMQDSDCRPGYKCENYECTPPICMVDSECPTGYECVNYDCVKVEEPEPEEPEEEAPAEEEPKPEEGPKIVPLLPKPVERAEEVVPLAEPPEERPPEPAFWEAVPAEAWGALAILFVAGIIYLKFFRWRR